MRISKKVVKRTITSLEMSKQEIRETINALTFIAKRAARPGSRRSLEEKAYFNRINALLKTLEAAQ